MVVKFTPRGVLSARAISPIAANPLDEFVRGVDESVQHFRREPVTPQRLLEFENVLKNAADCVCRQLLECEVNRLESDDKKEMPGKVRYQKETYRINKKTPAKIDTRFGTIIVRSFYYLNECDGEPGMHPLWLRLGIGAGSATPALLERVARMAVDHSQSEVRAWLRREHGVVWSNDRLRAAMAGFRKALLPFVADFQKARLLNWLQQAEQSHGRHRPVLAVGRDGIMIPMRVHPFQEASTATLSVYDRKRRRLGTIYLARCPKPNRPLSATV